MTAMTPKAAARLAGRMRLAGAALLGIGLAKASATAMASGEMMIVGCGGTRFALPLGETDWALVHCWGCYAAVAGAGLLLATVLRQRAGWLRPARHRVARQAGS